MTQPDPLDTVRVAVNRVVAAAEILAAVDQIEQRLAAFEIRYNEWAVPFDWKFGHDDLDKLIARIGAHEQAAA